MRLEYKLSVLTAANANADCWSNEAEDAQTRHGTQKSESNAKKRLVYGHSAGQNGPGKQGLDILAFTNLH